jgi:hypothetical protein
MLSAFLIDHDKAVAAVAIGEHQAAFFERCLKGAAAIGLFEAIEKARTNEMASWYA